MQLIEQPMQRNCSLVAFTWLWWMQAAIAGATPFGLDNIKFWVGSGGNRAGVAVDWDGDDLGNLATPSLAWGFRWEGAANLEDALRAILAADDRLYAKLSPPGGLGTAVYGLGYDLNDDGAFALDDDTAFGEDGVAETQSSDGVMSVDSADAYREGWIFSFWNLATAAGPVPTEWQTSQAGIASTVLEPDGWSSLAQTPSFNLSAFANQLAAAEPPGLPGDFNADGWVEAADYTVWQDTLGQRAQYELWRDHFGAHSPPLAAFALPEPGGFALAWVVVIALHRRFQRCRTRRPRVGSPSAACGRNQKKGTGDN